MKLLKLKSKKYLNTLRWSDRGYRCYNDKLLTILFNNKSNGSCTLMPNMIIYEEYRSNTFKLSFPAAVDLRFAVSIAT